MRKGTLYVFTGPSGAGKSTFIKLILREETPTKGIVKVNGYNLNKIKKRQIPQFRRSLGVVFQDFRLIPQMTVYDNVAFALRVTNVASRSIRQRVPYVLGLVGLAAKALGIMQSSKITSLYVVRSGEPVGILNVHDCLRAGVN